MEIIYFFEYRFPKPADFHFEMKQSSTASPRARRLLSCPERPWGPFRQILQRPSAVASAAQSPCSPDLKKSPGKPPIHGLNPKNIVPAVFPSLTPTTCALFAACALRIPA
ncbi:hypothetical protein NN561_016696 [Cricetulus griseus]